MSALEKFGNQARRVLLVAQEEARRTGAEQAGTEHLLVGLAAVKGCAAAQALTQAGISARAVRKHVPKQGRRPVVPEGQPMPLSSRMRDVLQGAARYAEEKASEVVGTDHLLLALLDDALSEASRIIGALGVEIGAIRARLQSLGEQPERMAMPVQEPKCSFCGLAQSAVRKLVAGPGVYICNGCIALCNEIVEAELGTVSATAEARLELQVMAGEEEAHSTSFPASFSGPSCRNCGRSIEGATGSRVIEASHFDRPGALRVLVVYCTACGSPVHSAVLPEER